MRALVTGGVGFLGGGARRELGLPPPTPLPEGLARTLEALRARRA